MGVDKMKILIGVPVHRPIEFKVFESFIRLANLRGKHQYEFTFVHNSLVYDARETVVESLLKSNCEALMFIDSDMTFHPQSVELLERHNRDIVTAKAFKRVEPYQPCFYTKVEMHGTEPHMESPIGYGEGLLKIQGCGMACVLIKRKVFEEMEAPYFFPIPKLGEDLAFCLKAQAAGFEFYCDTTLQFGHLGWREVMEADFMEYYEKHKDSGVPLYE